MPRNVEIKARVADLDALAKKVASFADEGPIAIGQDDTFFHCARGRLKLRMFGPDRGELIFYRRSDTAGPRESFYLRTPTVEPEALRSTLALAYGELGRVRKHRTLFLVGRTRVHLDRVEGRGEFLELEVVLADDEPTEAGVREADALLERLGIARSDLLEGAYLDL